MKKQEAQIKSILVRPKEAMKIIGIKKSTFYRWQKADTDFPQVAKKVMGNPLYKRSDIEAYANNKGLTLNS